MRGLCDKLTNVGDCLFEILVDLLLLPPTLCFLELPPAATKSGARPQVLANIESTHNWTKGLFGALQDI
jgi:hypothetical protein